MTIGVARATMLGAAGAAGEAQFFVGSFTRATSTGTQAVSGLGFTPKCLLFWTSTARTSVASGTFTTQTRHFMGFTSGPTESYSVSGASRDGVATSDTSRRIAAKAITLVEWGETTQAEADLDSFDSDGFTLDWTTSSAGAGEIMFLAIGGDDVEAKVVNWTSPTSSGNKAVTGVGFTPDVVLHAASVLTSLGSSAFLTSGFGCMDSSGNQWATAIFSADAAATSDTARYQVTSKAIASLVSTSTVKEEAGFVSMDADGFTMDFTTANANADNMISLCLSGVSAKAGTIEPSATGDEAVTGVGFEPAVLLAVGARLQTATLGTVTAQNQFSLGAADGTNQRVAAHRDRDGVGTTDADSIWQNDAVFLSISPSAATKPTEGTLSSFDSDGFTANFSAVESGAALFTYLALG